MVMKYYCKNMSIRKSQCRCSGCNKQSTFLFEGDKPQYCGTHRVEGIINFHNKHCQYDECNKQSTFAFEGDKPQYCGTHCVE